MRINTVALATRRPDVTVRRPQRNVDTLMTPDDGDNGTGSSRIRSAVRTLTMHDILRQGDERDTYVQVRMLVPRLQLARESPGAYVVFGAYYVLTHEVSIWVLLGTTHCAHAGMRASYRTVRHVRIALL